jgi:2-methylaconitate cis-trans-isomerase PrpF
MYQKNIQKVIEAEIDYDQNGCEMDGVAFPGQKVALKFSDPAGSITKKLFPTGNCKDKIKLDGNQEFEVTLIDSGMAAIFIRAEDLNLKGDESREELN